MQQFNTMFNHFSFLFSSFVAMHFTFNFRIIFFFSFLCHCIEIPTLQPQSNSDKVVEREEASRDAKMEKKNEICNCIRSFRMHATRLWTSLMKNWRQSVHRHFFSFSGYYEFISTTKKILPATFVNDIDRRTVNEEEEVKRVNSMTKTTNERRMKNIIFQFSESRVCVLCFFGFASFQCDSCRSVFYVCDGPRFDRIVAVKLKRISSAVTVDVATWTLRSSPLASGEHIGFRCACTSFGKFKRSQTDPTPWSQYIYIVIYNT